MSLRLPLAVFAALTLVSLGACDRLGDGRPEAGRDVPAIASALADGERERAPETRVDAEVSSDDPASAPPVDEVYPGTNKGDGGVLPTAAPAPVVGTLSVAFDGAGLEQALKVIIGDQLGLSYVLPPNLQGRVTLRTARPVSRSQMTALLETLLSAHGLAAVYEGDLVRVVQGGVAGGQLPALGRANGGPGYGLEVFSLSYVSATQMARLLEPFVSSGRVTPVGLAGDLIAVSGPGPERRAAERAIALLDVDRLAGQSVAIVGLAEASAEDVIPELNELFSLGAEGAGGTVRFTPIARMNAILVIAASEAQAARARTWIQRLDRTRNADERRLFVYFVKHGEAGTLVKTLQGAFEGDGFLGNSVAGASGDDATAGTARPSGESGPRFNADATSNAILVWATGREYELISEVLAKLDITPLQVLIEGTVLEVSLQDDLRYGLQYFIEAGEFSAIFTRGLAGNNVSPLTPGFGVSIGGPNGTKVVIDALSELTDVRVVSSPQLLVLDGGTARLHVGDQVPIVTRTSSATITDDNRIVNEIEYRDTGVTLNVTPKVKASGVVTLEVSQEVSDVVRTDSSDINSPTIQQRRVVSTAAVESGTTVLLAGLIREIQNDTNSGIPVLHQLPLVGDLFGTTDKSTQRTELVVLITPRVIRNRDEATEATRTLLRQYRGLIEQFRAPDEGTPNTDRTAIGEQS